MPKMNKELSPMRGSYLASLVITFIYTVRTYNFGDF